MRATTPPVESGRAWPANAGIATASSAFSGAVVVVGAAFTTGRAVGTFDAKFDVEELPEPPEPTEHPAAPAELEPDEGEDVVEAHLPVIGDLPTLAIALLAC